MEDLMVRAAVEESRQMTEQLRELDTDIDITLEDFERRVLPQLANRGEAFNVQAWITMTTHPNVGIRVLDKNGDVKYYVPPFLDNGEMRVNKDVNLSAFASDLDNITADRPRAKDSVLYNVLQSFSANDEDMVVSSVEAIMALNKIYADYDMPLIEVDDVMRQVYVKLKGTEPEVPVSNGEPKVEAKAKPVAEDIFEDDGFDLP
ncbi:hypothetical protein pVa21_212 [Vibrio phage pVa-21]|nr:hypothetical protein pVa21_212 [Vibrio phage pVa-21]